MKNIFIGFLLIFLDFNLDIGSCRIGLLPDFLGYIILIKGLTEMSEKSAFFEKVIPWAKGLAIYTGALYLFDLFGMSVNMSLFTTVLGLLGTAASLYVSYHVVLGVKDMEETLNRSLNAANLKTAWTVEAVCSILVYALVWFGALALLCLIIGFIAGICFLAAFYKSKNLYESAEL